MIVPDNKRALLAIQFLCVEGRRLLSASNDPKTFSDRAGMACWIFDAVEKLPGLIAAPDDHTILFRDLVESLARDIPGCGRAVRALNGECSF